MGYDQPPAASDVYCVQCGYDLTGTTIGGACPECGAAVAPSFQGSGAPVSGFAITSMVLGICGLALCVCYGVPTAVLGPLAIGFWYPARQQVRRGAVSASSGGMATAGLVCGIIGTVLAYGFWAAIFLTEAFR